MAEVELTRIGEAPTGADTTPSSGIDAASKSAPAHHSSPPFTSSWFTWLCIAFQIALIVLYGTCTTFGTALSPQQAPSAGPQLGMVYPMYMDVSLMMLIGFGYLYTLFRRYAWSGVSYNYLIVAFVVQWAVLLNGFWDRVVEPEAGFTAIDLNMGSFVRSNYSAATVLISFGAVIGRVSPLQLLGVVVWEVIWSCANEAVGTYKLGAADPGGSMYIHVFGAAFGLGLSWVLGDRAEFPQRPEQAARVTTSRANATFAMVGTLFLFASWPAFNAAMTTGTEQMRIVINTLLSIACSVVTAFALSKAIHDGTSFDMEHIQNSTVAGGVAIGTVCGMLVNPWGAMLTGSVAGIVSVYGFSFFSAPLKRLGISDTCGILNLHLMPGFIGGIAGAIGAAGVKVGASELEWSLQSAQESFPGRWMHGEERSALVQGGYQMAVCVISLVWGAAAGVLGGYLVRLPCFEPKDGSFYEDAGEWVVPPDEEAALADTIRRIIAEERHAGAAAKEAAGTFTAVAPTVV